jgi:hypothetical protein
VKTVADTPVCHLLEGVPIMILIIELLLILSINNGSTTTVDKWGLLAALHLQRS